MTLIVALEGKNGIALASDSRGTFGDPRELTAQNDTMQKLYELSDHAGLLLAGAGELGVSVVDAVRDEIKRNDLKGVTPIMEKFSQVANQKYQSWFPTFSPQPLAAPTLVRPSISAIIAGYDIDENDKLSDKKIYVLNSALNFAPQRTNYGFAISGVPQYALYLFNRLYTKDRSVEELVDLAVYAITETASQDGKVGGPPQAMKILDDGTTTKYEMLDLKRIIADNEKRSKRLKTSFFANGK